MALVSLIHTRSSTYVFRSRKGRKDASTEALVLAILTNSSAVYTLLVSYTVDGLYSVISINRNSELLTRTIMLIVSVPWIRYAFEIDEIISSSAGASC